MENVDILLTLAETGIVLAGFSGVILALRKPGDVMMLAENKARLQDLLISSLGVSMYSLFPLLLDAAQMDQGFVMQISSTFLAIFMVIGTVFMLRAGSGKISRSSIIFVFPSLLVLLLLGLVAFGKLPGARFFAYFFGLFWLLFIACANFFQLVINQVGGGSESYSGLDIDSDQAPTDDVLEHDADTEWGPGGDSL